MGGTPIVGLNMLIQRLNGYVREGQHEFFGPEAAEALRQAARARATAASAHIEYDKLHVNNRVKSGYVGVYQNGKGFRAMGLDPVKNAQITLGTFERADEAAWFRYEHYLKHDLPYGTFAEALEHIERAHSMQPESTKLLLAVKFMYDTGVPPDHIPKKYLRWYRKENDFPDEVPSAPDAVTDAAIAKLHANAAAREAEKGRQNGDVSAAPPEKGNPEVVGETPPKRKLGVGQFDPDNPPKFEFSFDEWKAKQS